MPIQVVCTGCKKRFSVNEKFAGQKGPCPSCKTIITIPTAEEEVVIHGPAAGTPEAKSRVVLTPIKREESKFSLQIAAMVVAGIAGVLVATILVGRAFDEGVPMWLQGCAAVLLGPPLAVAGYALLRNEEYEPYRGQDLLIRAGACGVAYAVLWGIYAYIQVMLGLDFTIYQLVYVAPPAVLAGAFAAFASLDLSYSSGLVHYGMYLIVTVLLRVVAGMPAF